MHNSKVDLLQFTSYSDLHETQQKNPSFLANFSTLDVTGNRTSTEITTKRYFCTFLYLTSSGTLEL